MFSDTSITTSKTLNNIKASISNSLKNKYGIEDEEIVESFLKIHGLHKNNFDFVNSIETIINSKINDVSIDSNANKNEKTIEAINQESIASVKKAVGFDYLYRQIKELYGRDEAKRLMGEIFDLSLGLSDSTNILKPYCFSVDASKIILYGRDFGQLQSSKAKRISSYISALCETVHQLSSHVCGAVAIGSYFLDIANLSLYGKEKLDLRELKTNTSYRKQLENEMQQFVHSVNHLSRSGVECFTTDIEVLTKNGFKKYNEVNVGDVVYTWKNGGELEFQKIDKINIFDYDGEMHFYKGRDLQQQVTPNHRILRKIYNTHEYTISFSKDIINDLTPTTIPISFKKYEKEDYNISDELLKLVTILFTDGSIKEHKIKIFKSIKRYGNELINEILNKLNIEYYIKQRNSKFSNINYIENPKYKPSIINVYNIFGINKQIKELLPYGKEKLPDWFFELSKRQLNIVLDVWMRFDGHGDLNKKSSKIKMQTDNYEIANQLQQLCVLAGYGSRITESVIGKNKKTTIYVKLYKRNIKDFITKEIVSYKGKVWCPTTKNGILMFRDKNKSTFISGNSPFTNLSIFDRNKLKHLVLNMPDFFPFDKLPITHPKKIEGNEEEIKEFYLNYIVDYIMEIQEIFLDFFDKGDPLKDGTPYRFPVCTVNLSKKKWGDKTLIEDQDFLKSICKRDIFRYNIFVSEGQKTSMCCRLLNDSEMMDYASQSNSFGGSGISLGSHRVCTINFMRIALEAKDKADFYRLLDERVLSAGKILKAHKELLKSLESKGLQPFITNGWLSLKRMFSTFGILGIYEAAVLYKEKFGNGTDAEGEILKYFNQKVNETSKELGIIGNIEQIPGESFAIRLVKADKLIYGDKKVPYLMYSNQFIPLWEDATIWERMDKTGKYDSLITGGSICHVNIGEKITQLQAEKIIKYAVNSNCQHFALNSVYSECEKGHCNFGKHTACPVCKEKIIEYYTRIIGFFTPVSSWQDVRREWEFPKRNFANSKTLGFD